MIFVLTVIKPSQENAYYVSPLMDLKTFLSHDNIRSKWLTKNNILTQISDNEGNDVPEMSSKRNTGNWKVSQLISVVKISSAIITYGLNLDLHLIYACLIYLFHQEDRLRHV